MGEFKNYHPIVNFIYFVFVIGFSCFFMHPFCLGISLMCGFIYSVMVKGRKAIKTNLIFAFPMLILMAIMNPLFNHEGLTIITYLPSGNPLTLESVIYGFAASAMIVSVILWFGAYNGIMTSDKFIYLFGRIIPSLSLILSMTLRFVPRFLSQLKVVINAQRSLGRDMGKGNIIKRAKSGLNILSIMTTWALENAIETADSMKSRGYGHPGRTAFSLFKFDKRDKKALTIILILGLYVLAGSIMGNLSFEYFPMVEKIEVTPFKLSLFAAYLLLSLSPVIIELWEVKRWKSLRSKI